MGEKVRILGIAPYKGLVTLMKRYAGQRDDIQLTAMLGNVETGLSLAKEHYRNYDIIISRANTCLLYTSPSPRDISGSRMPSSA